MKRCWFGGVILVVLLALGLGVTWLMGWCNEPVSQCLDRAAEAALAEDWEKTEALTGEAKDRWEKYWNLSAVFADHEPMEEIDGLFAQLEIYSSAGDNLSTAAVCAELSQRLEAMGDAHKGSWWNLL